VLVTGRQERDWAVSPECKVKKTAPEKLGQHGIPTIHMKAFGGDRLNQFPSSEVESIKKKRT